MGGRKKKPHPRRSCALCGREVSEGGRDAVVGSTGRVVCRACLSVARRLRLEEDEPCVGKDVLPPVEMIRRLDKSIIGQAEAKEAIAIALWKQAQMARGETSLPRMNLMLYGPTGCGKTALVRETAKLVDLPFLAVDSTTITETGYKGKDATDVIKLIGRYAENPFLPYGVIFLDEFDKLAARGSGEHMAYQRSTQHAFLKLVEGAGVTCSGKTVSTETLLFVFAGAFTGLRPERKQEKVVGFLKKPPPQEARKEGVSIDDFVHYGMEPELMGRIGRCVEIHALTEQELRQILLESELSAYRKYHDFFQRQGKALSLSRQQIQAFIQEAIRRGTGARGLNALVEQAAAPLLLRYANGEEKAHAR